MNIKAIVLMIAGLFIALWVGQAVGNGEYGTAIAVAGGGGCAGTSPTVPAAVA